MGWKAIALTVALAVVAPVHAAPSSYTVHEARGELPSQWHQGARLKPSTRLTVRIALAQSNLDKGYDYLMDVADPQSQNYGKHWTPEKVVQTFQASDETVRAVREWLLGSGVPSKALVHSDNKAWFAFHATAKQMETLLKTEYYGYEDRTTGGVMAACDRYHVPAEIQHHIDYITPGVKLLVPHAMPKFYQRSVVPRDSSLYADARPAQQLEKLSSDADKASLTECDLLITPPCIRALYDFPIGNLSNAKNSMGIYESETAHWNQKDLNLFFHGFADFIPNGTHPIDRNIDGGFAKTKNISDTRKEAPLDLAISYPIVYPQSVTVFDEDDLHYQSWPNDTMTFGFNTFLDAIDGSYCTYCAYGECGDASGIDPKYPDPGPEGYNGTLQCGVFKPTNVISISYGGQENQVPIAYQKRQCNEYMKLGLQGVSVFFASGDAGVGAPPQPSGPGCLGKNSTIFNPTWPPTCPYVTAVGATRLYEGHSVHERPQPESAAYAPGPSYDLGSGGGFSNIYSVPSYQNTSVATFFQEHDPPYEYYSDLAAEALNPAEVNVTQLQGDSGGIYNRIGRGYPDVAANGYAGAFYYEGEFTAAAGTSMSSPLFASLINRINEARLRANKSTVGFINPALYSHPEILNDVTNGTNVGCGTEGFRAAKGWDPVTGLGTPNYQRMLDFFMDLQ